MFEVFIKNGKNKVVITKIEPNPFLIAYFELKGGILKPKKVKSLGIGDLYGLAGFAYRFIYTYKPIKFNEIENYDKIYQEAERKKYLSYAWGCIRFAYSLIGKVPQSCGAKVSFKAV